MSALIVSPSCSVSVPKSPSFVTNSYSSFSLPFIIRFPRRWTVKNLSNRREREIVRAAAVGEAKNEQKEALTMLFQAEGTMNEAAIPLVTNALKGSEGISSLKVQLVEGIASVELTKETTLQATGVASGLVEIIQGSGFTLQTLNLSFEDEEAINEISL